MAPTAPTHARTSYALPRCAPRCETPNGDSTSPAHQRWDYRRSGLTAATPTQTRPTSASRGSATCGPQLSSGGEARQPLGVELKYAADDAFELPALIEMVAGSGSSSLPDDVPLSDGVVAQQTLDAVYFDTDDLRLAAAGRTLRRRTGGDDAGWHLKVPAGTAARSEIRLPPGRVPSGLTPRTVPDELHSMVWAQTLG